MTLLDKALKVGILKNRHGVYTKEEVQLALAWAKGQVGMMQVSKAMAFNKSQRNNIYTFLAIALKEGIKQGFIVIKELS